MASFFLCGVLCGLSRFGASAKGVASSSSRVFASITMMKKRPLSLGKVPVAHAGDVLILAHLMNRF